MKDDKIEPRKRWTSDEIRYLRRNYGKRSMEELSQTMGRSTQNIGIAAHVLGLRKGGSDVPLDGS